MARKWNMSLKLGVERERGKGRKRENTRRLIKKPLLNLEKGNPIAVEMKGKE